MKNILALDATTEICSAALTCSGKTYYAECSTPRSHAQALLPMVDDLLKESNLTLGEVDLIALTNGPGSFTGIRICIGVAQGLAYGANIPVATFSTLDVMAIQAFNDVVETSSVFPLGPVVVALDARMKEVYWAAYDFSKGGKPQIISEPKVSSPTVLDSWLEGANFSFYTGVGHGWPLVASSLQQGAEIRAEFPPKATGILQLIGLYTQAGVELPIISAETAIEPLYLRNEITWQKRKRIRTP